MTVTGILPHYQVFFDPPDLSPASYYIHFVFVKVFARITFYILMLLVMQLLPSHRYVHLRLEKHNAGEKTTRYEIQARDTEQHISGESSMFDTKSKRVLSSRPNSTGQSETF